MQGIVVRFSFADLPIRGQFVRLSSAWHNAIRHQEYEVPAAALVGQAMAISALLADGIKFDGKVALQATSNGQISTLLGECTQKHQLRGIARHNDSPEQPDQLLGEGVLAISLIPEQGEMHQGMVELSSPNIVRAIEHYFENSEQLPTRLISASNPDTITALLIQRLPASANEVSATEDDWHRLGLMLNTCSDDELLNLQHDQLLGRLFAEDTINVHPSRELEFACTCSRERSERALKVLGKEDLTALSNEADEISIKCEICGETYRWDSVEAHVLFETHDPQLH